MTAADFVATLVAPAGSIVSEAQIAAFSDHIAHRGGIVAEARSLDHGRAVDIFFAGGSVGDMSAALLPFDVLIQFVATRRKKILLADMESTIIEQEMLDELAGEIGLGAATADITRRAMNGELDFAASMNERVAQLKGQPQSLIDHVAKRMTFSPGAEALVAAMKQAGAKVWLVSGGFGCFVKIIADRLGFDRFFCNELTVENGILTGLAAQPVLDKNSKRDLLEKACADYGCTLADTVTVGVGANDVPMLQACAAGGGLGVAYYAKPKVRELIHSQINHSDLSALIYAQGLK